MSRKEHLEWAKRRAIECVERGNVNEAWASMASDLSKHPDTADHIGLQLGMLQLMTGGLATPGAMRHFIEGFN